MKKDRFIFVCQEAEGGRDAFVTHPSTKEEGEVVSCLSDSNHIVVETPDGSKRCWDYSECDELTRSSEEWPRR